MATSPGSPTTCQSTRVLYVKRIICRIFFFFSFSIPSLFQLCQRLLRNMEATPGDNLDIIATTLEIPENKKSNTIPGFWSAISNSVKAETAASDPICTNREAAGKKN